MKYLGFFALSIVLLSACAEWSAYKNLEVPPVAPDGQGADRWLEELHETRAMSPEVLQQALERREQAFLDEPDADNRMRLALLLAAGSEPAQDRERARRLLAEIDQPPATASEQELLAILQQFLDEQSEMRGKMHSLRKQVRDQSRRIEELEEQQRALTTIEQNIQQREKPEGIENGE